MFLHGRRDRLNDVDVRIAAVGCALKQSLLKRVMTLGFSRKRRQRLISFASLMCAVPLNRTIRFMGTSFLTQPATASR
jgi:hypothetical protein